ncbi:MAG: UbiD family decarboxylase [Deltaproteobacteria bacterium]|nr:UbiD family decarboxylase [Deltaproteobacteria bacterium]
MESFRTFLDDLRNAGELVDIHKPVDVRHIAALVDQSSTALLFHTVRGYGMPVVSGLLNDRGRIALSAGCDYGEMEQRLSHALDHPIDPVEAGDGGERGWFREGAAVDLFSLPVPVFSEFDGGPTITAGVTLARDPEHGLNAGTYRFQVKERNLTGIDIVTPNNLRRLAEKALAANAPLPISINIGTHPVELMASLYKAPLGRDELAIAGGMLGRPVRLGACRTVDAPCLADAEIVLEAEILPTGWTRQEGRFGEMTRLMGDVHYNPHVRVKAISRRQDAIYYALHMPWENIWIKEHGFQAVLKRVLDAAGVTVTAVNVTPGGCCHWHAVISIRKQPGDPQNAIMAALSVADLKHVVIVDDEIDVYDAMEVEWAMATRVQADRDITILSDARSKPLDPSLPLSEGIPTTAKCGIDATIPDGVPRARYQRITYPHADELDLDAYLGEAEADKPVHGAAESAGVASVDAAAARIRELLTAGPLYFSEIAHEVCEVDFPGVARAMGELHAVGEIDQDAEGRYRLATGVP